MKTISLPGLLLFFTVSAFGGVWVKLSLEQIVDRSDFVVVGELVRIKSPENIESTRKITRVQTGPNTYKMKMESTGVILYDTCHILIDEVLKQEKGMNLSSGDLISFSMPSRHNNTRSTADIRYDETDNGIWMLSKHKEKLWASHPMSLQKVEVLEEVRKIISELKSNPDRIAQ